MNRQDNLYTAGGVVAAVVGAILLFFAAQAVISFILEHWIAIIISLLFIVGGSIYLLSKDK